MDDQFTLGFRAALEAAAEAVLPPDDAGVWRGSFYEPALRGTMSRVLALPVPSLRETLAAMVQPLEWLYDERRGVWDAQDGFGGHYTVSDSQWFHRSLSEFIWVDGGDEAAKAAAQADYTRRILAALGVKE